MKLPDGWHRVALEEVAQIQTGLAKGKKGLLDPVALPYLRVANVQDGYVDIREVKTIEVARNEISRFSLQAGDVLMTEGGDFDKLGRGTVWNAQIEPCLHQNHVFAVRCDHARLLPEYLSWQSGSTYGRSYFLSCSKQTTNLASINSSQLKQFPVILPPLNEQREIAAIINVFEDAVAQTEKLIDAKHRRKKALMQQLLIGKQRFRAFAASDWHFRNSPIGHIPSDWALMPLGEAVEKIRRKNSKGVVRVLTASGEHGLVDQTEYFNRSVAGKDLSTYTHIKHGEFAYNRSLMNGYPYGATKRLDQYNEGVVSSLYLCFKITNKVCASDFLTLLFESGLLNGQLRSIVQVGARAHGLLNVTSEDFFSIEIPLPTLAEQQKIAAVLITADQEINQLKTQLTALRRQKQGLMQLLLTGKVRVATEVSA